MNKKVADDKIGPGVELCDPDRLKLLEKLQEIMGQASFLLCDLDYLERLATVSRADSLVWQAASFWLHTSVVDEIVQQCRVSGIPFALHRLSSTNPAVITHCKDRDALLPNSRGQQMLHTLFHFFFSKRINEQAFSNFSEPNGLNLLRNGKSPLNSRPSDASWPDWSASLTRTGCRARKATAAGVA
ncbi:hypothetical protein AJ78_02905 [Emergomyces pasteurianus Ep9510]|uniref:Uncharacterized protein n=1 Tax=Emergomyces pasteurianus Ep9510 TaxID=1447872 RepID=A0A1J9Q9Q1_9EURO|nr:hypothetical protein AJ78_02905 [Emergomyces pasteurianus Ep9510]